MAHNISFSQSKSFLARLGYQHLSCQLPEPQNHFGEGRSGLNDFMVQVIDTTNVNNPTEQESFWIEKIKRYAPLRIVSSQLFSLN